MAPVQFNSTRHLDPHPFYRSDVSVQARLWLYVLFTMFNKDGGMSVNAGISSPPHSILAPDVTALATYEVTSTLERYAAREGPSSAVVIAVAANLQFPIILACKRRDKG